MEIIVQPEQEPILVALLLEVIQLGQLAQEEVQILRLQHLEEARLLAHLLQVVAVLEVVDLSAGHRPVVAVVVVQDHLVEVQDLLQEEIN